MSILVAAPLGLSLLLGSPAGPEIGLVEAAGPTLPVAPRCSLGALMDVPEQRLEAVTVAAQFRGRSRTGTRSVAFHPADHRCVEVWGDEQWLWIAEEYDAPMARLTSAAGPPRGDSRPRARTTASSWSSWSASFSQGAPGSR